jgi:hypothetical protein
MLAFRGLGSGSGLSTLEYDGLQSSLCGRLPRIVRTFVRKVVFPSLIDLSRLADVAGPQWLLCCPT